MMGLWWKQIVAVMRLEVKKTFFARRGIWIYLLALAPVAIFVLQAIGERAFHVVTPSAPANGHVLTQDEMDTVKEGMPRAEIVARFGEPSFSKKQTAKRYDDDGKRITVQAEVMRYDGKRSIMMLFLDDGVLRSININKRFTLEQNNYVFAGVFEFFFIPLAVFFGCLGIFVNLFRGEMVDKSLHYYLLSPLRREVLLAGKFLAGVVAAGVIFTVSAALQIVASFGAFDTGTVSRYLYQDHGFAQIAAYLGVTVLACVGYGSVFLGAGLLFRNPIVPAAVVLIWEAANPLLPTLLKKFSVIYYLKSLCPVQIPIEPGTPAFLAMFMSNGDPISAYIAVFGLLAVAALILFASSFQVRRLEINYTTE